jgi:hypothetical protein
VERTGTAPEQEETAAIRAKQTLPGSLKIRRLGRLCCLEVEIQSPCEAMLLFFLAVRMERQVVQKGIQSMLIRVYKAGLARWRMKDVH